MSRLIFSGEGSVGLEQQFNGVAKILPSFFERLPLGNGPGEFFDIRNVSAALLFRNLFVNCREFYCHTLTQAGKFRAQRNPCASPATARLFPTLFLFYHAIIRSKPPCGRRDMTGFTPYISGKPTYVQVVGGSHSQWFLVRGLYSQGGFAPT